MSHTGLLTPASLPYLSSVGACGHSRELKLGSKSSSSHASRDRPCFVRILNTRVSVTYDQPQMQRSILRKAQRSAHHLTKKARDVCRSLQTFDARMAPYPCPDNGPLLFVSLCVLFTCMHTAVDLFSKSCPSSADPFAGSSFGSIFVLGAHALRVTLPATSRTSHVLRGENR